MALKAVLEKVDGLPEAIKKEYVEKDGRFHLQLEGDVPGFVAKATHDEQLTKLAEFRDNNRALNTFKTDAEAKLKTFEGVDPVEYKTLKDKLKNVGAENGDLQATISAAVKAATDPLIKIVDELKSTDLKKTTELATKTFESSLKDAAIKAGVDEKMMPMFVDYGLKTFKFEDGKFVPKKGDAPYYSVKSPGDLISPEEWAALQITEAPGFFKESGGGGSGDKSRRQQDGKKVIGTDPLEFGQNIEAISKGQVLVMP